MKSRLPSHSTVVAYLALFAALSTGGAYAAGKIGSSDIKPNAIKSNHIKNGQVKAKDIAKGVVGPKALAVISKSGPEFVGPVVGFKSISRKDTGVYCLTPKKGIKPLRHPAVVGVEWINSSGNDLHAYWVRNLSQCSTGQYEVQTYNQEGDATDQVSFTIVVP